METSATPVALHRALPPEEAARGDFYALLARLLRDAPDMALLGNLAVSPRLPDDGDAALGDAWAQLVVASSVMDADAAAEEFESLFAGVGKAAVSIYAGYYSGAPAADHPRVRIVRDLAALGLAHRESVTEPEDHFAGLFDAMRVLVSGGAGRAPSSVAEQKKFFMAHVEPAARKFFEALGRAPASNYYRKVAAFGAAFAAFEKQSFELD
jgi:TorA maturation chaperone TorD